MNKEEYTNCIEDDIAFLERHLPKDLFNCLWCGHIKDVLRESIALLYDQPSLPSDVDEAAEEKYPVQWKPYPRDGIIRSENEYDVNADRRDAFKAGAKWRDAQIPKLPNDVEKAALDYCKKCNYINEARDMQEDGTLYHSLEADTAIDAFKAGVAYDRAKMMEEAVEGEISSVDVGDDSYVKTLKLSELQKAIRKYNRGDKVRLIVIKDEGK